MSAIGASHTASTLSAELKRVEHAKLKVPIPPPTYSDYAQQVVVDYLDSEPVSLPVASGVPKDLGRSYTPQYSTNSKPSSPIPYLGVTYYKSQFFGKPNKPGYYVIDEFIVTQAKGDLLVSVPMEYSKGGPVLGDVPSVQPAQLPSGAQASAVNNYTGQGVTLTGGERSQINNWASAYFSDNSVALFKLTGDTANTHTYTGIAGWVLDSKASIVKAVEQHNEILVEVSFSIAPKSSPTGVALTRYDLLLTNIHTPFPNVAAWGPAGAGWTLKPFANAMSGSVG
jgi:hypothetical protein